ncbi:RICIN domain-containing protein [Erwinia sp. S38]|uniref:RICIN domain-containing protein n=1 Tax=Erwinia sp. S38 TaxID=2769338 RepID=UPI001909262D|nr:RICIN domain-containing protein [Erwinia sp. S38]MBK0002935.1 RICIN domain-containing protein [Erwinia sp. S38]
MIKKICHQFSPRLLRASDRTADVSLDELNGHTFAIQNISFKKNLRPYKARKHDGNPVILYVHHAWKCMTWRFSQAEDGNFRLINYYTGKMLDTKSLPYEDVPLVQNSAVHNTVIWEFTEVTRGIYTIGLVGTQIYITASSDKTNSPIILSHFTNSSGQKWRLIRQKPWF